MSFLASRVVKRFGCKSGSEGNILTYKSIFVLVLRLGKHLAMLEALREVMRRVAYWTSGADLNAMYGIPLWSIPLIENCVYIDGGKSALACSGAL